jgi:hypothetical protein
MGGIKELLIVKETLINTSIVIPAQAGILEIQSTGSRPAPG